MTETEQTSQLYCKSPCSLGKTSLSNTVVDPPSLHNTDFIMTSKPSVAGKDQAEFPSPEPILTFEPNVTVRPIQMSDAPSMAYHANNKKISIRLSKAFPYPYKVEDAQAFISLRLSPERQIASGAFDVETGDGTGPKLPTVYAICIDDQCVGTLGLVFQSDATCRVASIGYWIGEEFWSKGIISKVVPAFVRWGFETFGRLMRLEGGGKSFAAPAAFGKC